MLTEFADLRGRAGMTMPETAEFFRVSIRTIQRYEKGKTRPRPRDLQALKGIAMEHPEPWLPLPVSSAGRSFSFIDLFAGIGGLRMGFEGVGGKCVFTSEWDRFAQQTYKANFPHDDHEISGDITKVQAENIPEHDVLLAGFPCQPFSIAGVSKKNSLKRPHGFACDTQGTLFFDVARLIAHHRPRAFVLENVRNLASHDRGQTFKVILDVLVRELGYHVDTRVIDAKPWLPQHRERIFIVGFRDVENFTFDNFRLPSGTMARRLDSVLHPQNGSEETEEPYTIGSRGKVSPKYTLSRHLWGYLQAYAEKHRKKGNGFGFGLVGPKDTARTLSARYYKDGSEILIRQRGKPPRRLTPRECARLMGFDPAGGAEFKIPVSDTQAYKQFGNSVAVPVVKSVASHMLPFLIEITKPERLKKVA